MINRESVEAVHAAICEESLADHLDPDWRGKCVKAVEAAAPFIRAQALEDAAGELARLVRIGRTPVRDITKDEEADYREFESSGSHECWLRTRAVTERGGE